MPVELSTPIVVPASGEQSYNNIWVSSILIRSRGIDSDQVIFNIDGVPCKLVGDDWVLDTDEVKTLEVAINAGLTSGEKAVADAFLEGKTKLQKAKLARYALIRALDDHINE